MPTDHAIEIYKEFGTDFQKLSGNAKRQVEALLKALPENPYEPNLQRKCFLLADERFGYPLDGGYSVIWKVDDSGLSVTELEGKVHIVAIEPGR